MKFSADSHTLKNILEALDLGSGSQVLDDDVVSISVSQNSATFYRNNNFMGGMFVSDSITCIEAGVCALEYKKLLETLDALPKTEVLISVLMKATIECSIGKYQIKKGEYRPPSMDVEGVGIALDSDIIIRGLESTVHYPSVESAIPYLYSVIMSFDENKIRFVGTDSFIMSAYETAISNPDYKESIMIPASSARVLLKNLTKGTIALISIAQNYIFIKIGSYTYKVVRIAGSVPKIESVINQKRQYSVDVDVAFHNQVKNIAPYKDGHGLVELRISHDKVILYGNNVDLGNMGYNLEPAVSNGKMNCLLNYAILRKASGSIQRRCVLRFEDASKSICFEISDNHKLILIPTLKK